MIYCCPQSEWFLLGAMEGDLQFAPTDRANCLPLKGELQFAPTAGQFASYWGSELSPLGRANCNSPLQVCHNTS